MMDLITSDMEWSPLWQQRSISSQQAWGKVSEILRVIPMGFLPAPFRKPPFVLDPIAVSFSFIVSMLSP